MSKYPDGAYNYYATEQSTRPIICELMADYVSETGEQHWRPLSQYPGRFVRLQEVQEMPPELKNGGLEAVSTTNE